ncbi:TVP38/TMEM64 family protein [Candidatus Pacearchaeota archaeon]|nr:TVP38/TMEM64 family protein [Candidatus Pacearchaeota archaeon]
MGKKRREQIYHFIKTYWLFVIVVLLIVAAFFYSYYSKGIVYSWSTSDVSYIVDFIRGFGILAAIIFVALTVVEVIVAPVNPFVLYIAGGMIFGAFLGGLLALIGNVIGAVIDFFIARRFGRKIFKKTIDPKKLKKFDKFTKKYGGLSMFLLRINPFTSSDIFSYLAGLSGMSITSLILGTFFGLAPLIYLQTYIGEDFIKKSPILFFIFILISVLYFIILTYLIWLARKRQAPKKKKKGKTFFLAFL